MSKASRSGGNRKRERSEAQSLTPEHVHNYTHALFGEDLHAKRVASLAGAASGVLAAGALGVHAIGRGLAAARGLSDKHAIKQVDGLVGNSAVDVWSLFSSWVPQALGVATEVAVNMDWTEFDKDDHSMLVLGTQTAHGRSTPLLWKTVVKSELAGQRNDHEDQLLVRLAETLPPNVKVTVVADRGFADQKLYSFLKGDLGFDFIIRFRGDVFVQNAEGEQRRAVDWLGPGGRMRVLKHAKVTADQHPVGSVVVVQDKGMKEPWCLAVSDPNISGATAKRMYGKRFSVEETFRDIKDLHYGMGMSWNRIGRTDRRDRMFLLAAMAHGILTTLGKAGERVGLDRLLKANTTKKRTLSLFRQGLRWYQLIPNMPEERLQLLMESFAALLKEDAMYEAVFGYAK